MSEGEVSREETGSKGRYSIVVDGHEAELTYSRLGATQVIADHTGVPDALSGRGVGLKLVERLVADARAEGFKIVPLCPFVNAMRRRHPDWADAFKV
ncbi:GNAT family N-acetyltransferase [Sulfitobacter alexandrii]|uniref:GNAT family N-acetyltransferase n=1 Tax=Sulfitobacter alexandrii TaxID=1917485 RepID=A0A1J0WIR0_9RHOB|nr:GNAT family N-acetyltransferase [Sulfitobacter alexandrii]APE44195.1 GNAT family N-acetyltransferase [Sulfitobacter alexandrii]